MLKSTDGLVAISQRKNNAPLIINEIADHCFYALVFENISSKNFKSFINEIKERISPGQKNVLIFDFNNCMDGFDPDQFSKLTQYLKKSDIEIMYCGELNSDKNSDHEKFFENLKTALADALKKLNLKLVPIST